MNIHPLAFSVGAEDYVQKRDKMVDKAASKLDLNADQKKRLSVLADKLMKQRTTLVGQTKTPRAEMQALVAGDKFEAVLAQALINETTTALQAKSPEVIAVLADFYNSLNAEQQKELRDYTDGRGRRISHSTARTTVWTSATGFEPLANPGFPAGVAGSP